MSKNFSGWNEDKLRELQASGKIRDYKVVNKDEKTRDTKKPKYFNEKVQFEGQEFDSKKEFRRWCELRTKMKKGHILMLERQVRYRFEVNGENLGFYDLDLKYWDVKTQAFVHEDVKSKATRKLQVYRKKKKLMKALYQIEIIEV
jgi:hypothetical protein